MLRMNKPSLNIWILPSSCYLVFLEYHLPSTSFLRSPRMNTMGRIPPCQLGQGWLDWRGSAPIPTSATLFSQKYERHAKFNTNALSSRLAILNTIVVLAGPLLTTIAFKLSLGITCPHVKMENRSSGTCAN